VVSDVDWDEYARTYRQIERDAAVPTLLAGHLTGRSGTAIDVGCGEGDLLDRLAQGFPAWDVSGFEISAFRADLARSRGHRVSVDAAGRVPPGQHDVAISCHVIEHVPDDRDHARQLAEQLRPGGVAYVETPLKLAGAWYFRKSPTAGWVLDPTHIREYRSIDSLCEVLHAAGLTVVAREAVPLAFPLGAAWALARRILHRAASDGGSTQGLAAVTVPIPRYRVMGVLAVKQG
jgi:2-polyprenyl-3-methyl-5-hydroxy-6-metoxy-1,4-benzoquinol methylase